MSVDSVTRFDRLLAVAAETLGGAEIVALGDEQQDSIGMLAGDLTVRTAKDFEEALKEASTSGTTPLIVPQWGPPGRNAQSVGRTSPAGPVGLIVPAAQLRMRLPSQLRHLGEAVLVVEGTIPLAGRGRTLAVALVVVDPAAQHPLVTRFFRDPSGQPDDAVIKDLSRLLACQGGTTEYGFVRRGDSLTRESLRYEDHDPRVAAKTADLAGFGEGGTVAEVFDVLIPRPPMRGSFGVGEDIDNAMRVLRGRDLSLTGELLPPDPDTDERHRPTRVGVELRSGDLVMREIELPGRRGMPVRVTDDDLPAAAGPNLIVLRAKSELDPELVEFYRLYLASERSRIVMRPARMGDHIRLMRIRECPLPMPDHDLVEALRDIRRAQITLRNWADDAVGLTSDAFRGPADAARRSLIETGRELRQRVEAAGQVGSLDHRISSFYPYPIAHKWRRLRVAESANDGVRAYDAILDCYEATMVFGASLALTCANKNGIEVGAMREIRRKLSTGGGLGLGDWVNVLKFVSSSGAFRRLDPDAPLASIRALLPEGSEVAVAQERLTERRNDESHRRALDSAEIADAVALARVDLELILENAGFLTDLPVYQIQQARWDSLQGSGEAVVEVLRGDHPVSPTRTISHKHKELETDSLYVQDLSGELVLLRPFLIRHRCPECRSWSTFHPDRRHRGQLYLKAVDHAHTINGSAYEGVLAHVGYIERSAGSATAGES